MQPISFGLKIIKVQLRIDLYFGSLPGDQMVCCVLAEHERFVLRQPRFRLTNLKRNLALSEFRRRRL